MKINLNKKPAAGVVLIVALFVIVTAGIVLASYFTLMSSESRIEARSQVWGKCIPVMEAGVEEAMAEIQYCGGSTNLGSNGWTLNATNYYQKTRNVGTNGSYCVVRIQPVNPPVIYSTAYVPIPDATNYLSRTVRVNTTNGFGSGGLVAKGSITMSGNTQLDSYNSNIAPYNSSSPGTNAIAKTLATTNLAINLGPKGSAHIFGLAVTGVGGTIGMGGGSYIGPPGSGGSNPGGKVITAGWTNNDANFQINSNSPPDTSNGWSVSSSLPSGGGGLLGLLGLGTNKYTYVYTAGNYELTTTLALTGTQTLGISGNVKLYVTGSFLIANGTSITIGTNSSLTLYVGGTTITVSGAGFVNKSSSPSALTIYGLSSCTTVNIGNSGAFYGTINTPNANVNVSGAGDVYGQITANSIDISGGGSVHYDQALGGSQFFNAFCWNEL